VAPDPGRDPVRALLPGLGRCGEFGIRVLLLFAVKEALSLAVIGSFNLGQYVTGFFTGVYDFLLPVGLTLLVVYFWKRYLSSMMP